MKPKPFIKWVGGKRSILSELTTRLPESYDNYHEPFIGGGALLFEVFPKKSFISDINQNLIYTYQSLKDNVDEVIKLLEQHKSNHDKEHFLKSRNDLFTNKSKIEIAALFIYLNKTCFNGLYRVNKSGKFNVPMGSYKNPSILDKDNLLNVSKFLQTVDIQHKHFSEIEINKDDFYYFDPPYHKTFSNYGKDGFDESEHEKLANLCKTIHNTGGYFMVSNSDTDFIKELYKDFKIEYVMANRSVSCVGTKRNKEREVIIRNY